MQVLASNGLLDDGSTVSFGTSVHRSIAALVIDRVYRLCFPSMSFKDGDGRFVEGPKGSGKTTMLRAMCKVVPILAPSVLAVYVDATDITDGGPETYSVGNAVWSRLKDDPGAAACLRDASEEFQTRVGKGDRLLLSRDIMPALVAGGKQLVVVVDEAEEYFRVTDDKVKWAADFTFFGNLNGMPTMGIIASSSPNLDDLLRGNEFLRSRFPKTGMNFNVTKIKKYILSAADPFSLRVASAALTHEAVKESGWTCDEFSRALLMIGGGLNARHLVLTLLTQKQEDLALAASKPFDVEDDGLLLPEATDLALAAHHLYHEMFVQNERLWERSGVAKILRGAGLQTADGHVQRHGPTTAGASVTTGGVNSEIGPGVGVAPSASSRNARNAVDAPSSKEEVLRLAVAALARYIAERGDSWVEDFTWVSRDALEAAFKELQHYGGGLRLPRSASHGLSMLIQHRHLVDASPTATAPSLAHIIAAHRPLEELITDVSLRPYVMFGET